MRLQQERKFIFRCCLIFLSLFLILTSCDNKEEERIPDSGFIKGGQYLGDYYPTDGWRECGPAEVGMDPVILNDLGNRIGALVEEGTPIEGVMVVKDGYIVGEYYSPEYAGGNVKHVIHSCTKSFTSACIGIAIDKGLIPGVEKTILPYFGEYFISNPDQQKASITIEHLLTMSAGFDWNELDVPYTDPENAFYQWRRAENHIRFILDRSMEYAPGTMQDYNSGCSDLLSVILQQATGTRLDSFASEHLLKPLGIDDYYWEIDRDGHANGYGQMQLSSLRYINQAGPFIADHDRCPTLKPEQH